jgi:hypothetical protein
MAINRADIAKQLLPGLNAIFGLEYSAVDEEHMPLFDIESSDRAFEEEVLMTGFGAAPTKAEGSAVVYDTAQESWTSRYTHETVALAFAVTEEAMEDNLYDTFAKIRARALARAMAQTKQVKAANVYNNGFSASYVGGDGVALFSSAHPTIGDGNQSNLETAADLAEGTLETAIINTHKIKDDRGIFIGASPVSLHVAPDGQFDADRILASPGRPSSPNNDINAVRNLGLVPQGYFVNRRFTDADAWFLRNDCPNGTKLFVRAPLATKMEPDFDTGNLRFKTRERYSFGWSDWRQWRGNAGV